MLTKFANIRVVNKGFIHDPKKRTSSKDIVGFSFKPRSGFLYTTVRAISSRVNRNFDFWSEEELKGTYKSFVKKPIFVDHYNSDKRKTRGVILDSKFYPRTDEDDAWVELLLEIDAKTYPKLAQAILSGRLNTVSMGCNVEYTECSVCGKKIYTSKDNCIHIRSKGAVYRFKNPSTGALESTLAFEKCHGSSFFEISYVFDPADPSAEQTGSKIAKTADTEKVHRPQAVDTLRENIACPVCGNDFDGVKCRACGYETPPDGLRDPDTTRAKDNELPVVDSDESKTINERLEGEQANVREENDVQSRQRVIGRKLGGKMKNSTLSELLIARLTRLEKAVATLGTDREASRTEATLRREVTNLSRQSRKQIQTIKKLAEDVQTLLDVVKPAPETTIDVMTPGSEGIPAEVVDPPTVTIDVQSIDPGVDPASSTEVVLPAPVVVDPDHPKVDEMPSNDIASARTPLALQLVEARIEAGLAKKEERWRVMSEVEKMSVKDIRKEIQVLKSVREAHRNTETIVRRRPVPRSRDAHVLRLGGKSHSTEEEDSPVEGIFL